MSAELALLLGVIGLAVGAFGTIIGAGGGFLLVPALLLLFPKESPASLVSVSLAAVFFNGLSGSIAYARQGRVDYRSALLLAAVALPGAVLGAFATRLLPRPLFSALFGTVMVLAAGYLLWRPSMKPAAGWKDGWTVRRLEDREGYTYMYSFSTRRALGTSFVIGFISNLLGIGGGIVQVPVLLWLHFPLHIATATSHAVLTITSLSGVLVHLAHGEYAVNLQRTLLLAAAVVVGAQIGARVSQHLRWGVVMRVMAVTLVAVGIRLLMGAFVE